MCASGTAQGLTWHQRMCVHRGGPRLCVKRLLQYVRTHVTGCERHQQYVRTHRLGVAKRAAQQVGLQAPTVCAHTGADQRVGVADV
jgi:hypothetical protein